MRIWTVQGAGAAGAQATCKPLAGRGPLLNAAAYSRPWQFAPGFADVMTIAGNELQAVINGNQSVSTMLQKIQSAAQQALSRRLVDRTNRTLRGRLRPARRRPHFEARRGMATNAADAHPGTDPPRSPDSRGVRRLRLRVRADFVFFAVLPLSDRLRRLHQLLRVGRAREGRGGSGSGTETASSFEDDIFQRGRSGTRSTTLSSSSSPLQMALGLALAVIVNRRAARQDVLPLVLYFPALASSAAITAICDLPA